MGRQVAEAKAMSQKAASAKADAQIAKGALQKAASAREAHQERKTPAAKALAPMQGIPEDDGYYSTWPIPEVASAPTPASAPSSAPIRSSRGSGICQPGSGGCPCRFEGTAAKAGGQGPAT